MPPSDRARRPRPSSIRTHAAAPAPIARGPAGGVRLHPGAAAVHFEPCGTAWRTDYVATVGTAGARPVPETCAGRVPVYEIFVDEFEWARENSTTSVEAVVRYEDGSGRHETTEVRVAVAEATGKRAGERRVPAPTPDGSRVAPRHTSSHAPDAAGPGGALPAPAELRVDPTELRHDGARAVADATPAAPAAATEPAVSARAGAARTRGAPAALPPRPEGGSVPRGVRRDAGERDDVDADECRADAFLESRQDDGGGGACPRDVLPPPRAGDDGSREAERTGEGGSRDDAADGPACAGPPDVGVDRERADVSVPSGIVKSAVEETVAAAVATATEHTEDP